MPSLCRNPQTFLNASVSVDGGVIGPDRVEILRQQTEEDVAEAEVFAKLDYTSDTELQTWVNAMAAVYAVAAFDRSTGGPNFHVLHRSALARAAAGSLQLRGRAATRNG